MDVAHTYEKYMDAKKNNKGMDQFYSQDDLEAYHKQVTGKE
jgi:hypothetical protein